MKFQKVKRDFNPDIIHAHVALGIGVLATFLGKLYGIPVVISEHTPVELIDYKNNKMNQKTGRYVYRNSKFNSCCSNDLKNKLQQIFPTCKFDTIYNGLNQPRLDENVKEKYRINDVINIVIVAILYDKEIKGMQYLLPAIKKVKEKGKKIVLHHIGGGEYLEYYKNVCKDLELEDSCIFYGQCEKEKVNNIISEMDFFVSASLMEASGVSVMEAMMLGKPILGTNSGGVDSLVPEFAGKIVNKGSSSALEQGILYMVEHLLEFDENKIRKYAIENYDMDTISQRYMQVYEHIVRK